MHRAKLIGLKFFQQNYKAYVEINFDKPIKEINQFEENLLSKKFKVFSVSGYDDSLSYGS
jgi:hypothetical protein